MPLSRREFVQQMSGLCAAAGLPAFTGFVPQTEKRMDKTTDKPLPTYHCPKVKPFTLDGDLTKPVWKAARAVRLVSSTGKPQRLQPTTLRACWSDTYLYVGFRCTDKEIKATFMKRDEPLYNEDVVEVFLSLPGDLTHYFELEFSPNNVIFDAKVVNPGDRKYMTVDTSWNCDDLQCAVKKESGARAWWSVEVAVPFACLDTKTPTPGDRWRANFYRIDYATPPEFSAWSPTLTPTPNYHVPSRFGWLEFDLTGRS